MLIKALLLLFIIFVVGRVISRWRGQDVRTSELILWLVFWIATAGVVIWPQVTDPVARYVGIGRGADLLVYVSVLVLFFLAFRLLAAVHRIERDITTITRAVALTRADEAAEIDRQP